MWYPSLSIASMPIALVSSILMNATCSSCVIISRLSVYLTRVYAADRSVVAIYGGLIRFVLTSGLLALMMLMASLMFSAACWCGFWFLASLVPVMMSILLFFIRSWRVCAVYFSSPVVYFSWYSMASIWF